jgi:hypothetical protein
MKRKGKAFYEARYSGKLNETEKAAVRRFWKTPITATNLKKFNTQMRSNFFHNADFGNVVFDPVTQTDVMQLLEAWKPGWEKHHAHSGQSYLSKLGKIRTSIRKIKGNRGPPSARARRMLGMNIGQIAKLSGGKNKFQLARHLRR